MLQRPLAAVMLWSLVVLALSAELAAAERRVALVLGNSAYAAAGLELVNPRTDAGDVAAALQALGFEVLVAADADKVTTDRAIETFARMATGADTALFYYAGHALQFEGRNYLLPIDADVRDEISLPFATISVETIRQLLARTGGVKIMVLDACRNNPVAARLGGRATAATLAATGERTRGIERIDKGAGLIIAYAAAPDAVALDGQGRNSPYTTAFLRRLDEAGLEIGTMFRKIAADVDAATGGRQRPETYVSLISEYYLNRNDKIAWQQIAAKDDAAALRDFFERFPSSYYALEARYKLAALERASAAETLRREEAAGEPGLAATIDAAPAKPDPVDPAAQVRAAQVELYRLGCFDGRPTGKLDPRTEAGLRRYLEAKGAPVASGIAVEITDGLLSDLKQQDEAVCLSPLAAEPEPARPGRKEKAKASAGQPSKGKPAEPAPSSSIARDEPRRAPAAASARPSARPPAPVAVGGGVPAGPGGHGPAMTGVGF